MPTIIIGLIAIFTSVLGFATYRWKNPCIAIPFGLVNLVMGVSLLMLTVLVNGYINVINIDDFRKRLCGDDNKIARRYTDAVDRVMCSDICPCNAGGITKSNKKLWESQDRLKDFDRKTNWMNMLIDQKNDFKKNSINAKVVPLTWNITGGYNTYMDCYNAVLKQKYNNPENLFNQKDSRLTMFFDDGALEFL